jgi:gluconokinase
VAGPTSIAPHVVVLLGPAGAGKTTVGRALAASLGWRFEDADDYHDPENVARMRRGEALVDADRWPWLAALRAVVARQLVAAPPDAPGLVLACSALRRAYRAALVPEDAPPGAVRFVLLQVPAAELERRLEHRRGHYASAELLQSQFDTLELPASAEGVLVLDADRPMDEIVATIRRSLLLDDRSHPFGSRAPTG